MHIRDFQTARVVAFVRGCLLYAQRPDRLGVMGKWVRVDKDYLNNCIKAVQELVDLL